MALFGGLVLFWSGAVAQTPSAAPADQASLVAEGRRLYEQSCASCHGSQGEGTADGPNLQAAGAAAADFMLRTGRMPLGAPSDRPQRQPPAFGDPQIQALVAYVASLGNGSAIPNVVVDAGDITLGRSLYIQNCAACHAATGAGDAIGGGFVAPPLNQATPEQVGEAMLTGPGSMPVFGFDQHEVDSIARYIAYLQEGKAPGGIPLGGAGPVPEGFVAVVIGAGAMLLAVRWIARGRTA